ncbi:MAG: AAA family ATPase [Muribaculaceae bacterium]|nr:AAA family ATPase [Muribaculaceae bacterium]
MKRIVLFSHKGGVSKTTTIFHIGWKIAELGHKVLLVDADSQCNLSSYFLGGKFDEYYSSEETKNNNIKDGVSVAFESKPTPITALTPVQAERNKNLFLMPGHMNLSEYDATLLVSMTIYWL